MFEVMVSGLVFVIALMSLVVITDSALRWLSAYKRLSFALQQDIAQQEVVMPRLRTLDRTQQPFRLRAPSRKLTGTRQTTGSIAA